MARIARVHSSFAHVSHSGVRRVLDSVNFKLPRRRPAGVGHLVDRWPLCVAV
jgi:hypothetical protein